jgi:hypothetical protein
MAIKKDDTPASQLAPKAAEAVVEELSEPRRYLLSEGTRTDLDTMGEVTDPTTGHVLKKDKETGKVTATNRATGEVVNVA